MAVPVHGQAPRAGQAQPVFAGGRRWPEPKRMLQTVWRLSVGYWRPLQPGAGRGARPGPPAAPARGGRARWTPRPCAAIARMPLRAVKPQQPLDIGLFETPLPENPDIIIPDE